MAITSMSGGTSFKTEQSEYKYVERQECYQIQVTAISCMKSWDSKQQNEKKEYTQQMNFVPNLLHLHWELTKTN